MKVSPENHFNIINDSTVHRVIKSSSILNTVKEMIDFKRTKETW